MSKICNGCKSFLIGKSVTVNEKGFISEYHVICFREKYPHMWKNVCRSIKKYSEYDGHCKSCTDYRKEFNIAFHVLPNCKCHCTMCIKANQKINTREFCGVTVTIGEL